MELSAGSLLFLSLVSLVIFASFLKESPKKRRPPGPYCLPFVGSLHHLLTSQPQVALRDLAKKYGPVMYLRLGQEDAVVVSSPTMAREVLREKDISFASRPNLLASEIFLYGSRDIAMAPYGAYWRALRKLCTVELLSGKMVRQLAPVRDGETLSLCRKIQAAGQGGKPVNLARLLMSCSNTIVAKSAFGEACSAELLDQFLSALYYGMTASGWFCIGDLFPSLRFMDVLTGLRYRLSKAHRQMDAVCNKIVDLCAAHRGDNLVSVMLRIKEQGGLDFEFDATNMKAIIVDIFAGGTDTTSSVAEWIMSELVRNPEVMAKVQAEVRQAFDNKSPQEHEGQMGKLSYTKLVIKEALRLYPPVLLLVPHCCRETSEIGGFEVTEGTRVIANIWAIGRSPEYWQDADKFRPERFEDDATLDYKGSNFKYLPFGTGRRMCPGDIFGLAVLELIVARLLYYFNWSLPNGIRPDELDMDMQVSITLRRKNPLHLVALPYKAVPE